MWTATGNWGVENSTIGSATRAATESPGAYYVSSSDSSLTLLTSLDLSSLSSPALSFNHVHELETDYDFASVEVSTDSGSSWTSIASYSGSNPPLREQLDLSAYATQSNFLVRFRVSTDPTVVKNGWQSDALTYHFEVYDDVGLTNLVAEVPAVASGLVSTSWVVDVNLPDNGTYWWRARANDGIDYSPWSDASVFFVNELNFPPNLIEHIGPPNSAILYDLDEWLVWRLPLDPDVGDSILDYTLQIDDDPAFGSPNVIVADFVLDNAQGFPGSLLGLNLGSIQGTDTLTSGRWYWRVRARDSRFSNGPWPTNPRSFKIASDYDYWLSNNYTIVDQDNPLLTGYKADPDGDNIPLMMEYACAMDATVSSQEGAPEQVILDVLGVSHVAWEFDRLIGTELLFNLEMSYDLNSWVKAGATVEVLHQIDAETERCRLVDPQPIDGEHFVRLTINLP